MDNNKKLVFDLNNIMDFVFTQEDVTNQTEVTEVYALEEEGALELVNRQLNENKGVKNDSNTAIRYDLVKSLMQMVCNVENNNTMSLGEEITINTLISHGILKEV